MRFLSGFSSQMPLPPGYTPELHRPVTQGYAAMAGLGASPPKVQGWQDGALNAAAGGAASAIEQNFTDELYNYGTHAGNAVILGVDWALKPDDGKTPPWLGTIFGAASKPFVRGMRDRLGPFFGKKLIFTGVAVLAVGMGVGWWIGSSSTRKARKGKKRR